MPRTTTYPAWQRSGLDGLAKPTYWQLLDWSALPTEPLLPYPCLMSGGRKAAPLGESSGAGLLAGVVVLKVALCGVWVWTAAWTGANFCGVHK